MSNTYQARLTSTRGVASLIVIFYHCFLAFPLVPEASLTGTMLQPGATLLFAQQMLGIVFNGDAAVMVFFVLSGCVLAMQLDRRPFTAAAIPDFYVRRVFRIYPLAIVAVLLGLAIVWMLRLHFAQIALPPTSAEATRQATDARALLRNLSMLDNDLDPPLWSLKVEIYLSLAFPLIYLAVRRPLTLCAAIMFSTWLLCANSLGHDTTRQAVLAFVLGAALTRYSVLRRDFGRWEPMLMIVALCVLMVVRRVLEPTGLPRVLFLLPETLCAWAIIRSVFMRRPDLPMLDRLAVIRLGDLSYGLYVLHEPVLWLVSGVFAAAVGIRTLTAHPFAAALALFVVAFPIVLALSWLAHRSIELPFLNIGRRLARRPSRGDHLTAPP